LTEAQRCAIDEATHQLSDSIDYAVTFANVSGCMENLGMFVKDRLSAMDSGHHGTLLRLSASTILELVDGITAVVAERTEDNEAYI
jgi:energy-converting hydrogenase Eha subunit B